MPLFVEEMTKAVLEAESEGDALKTTAAVPSSAAGRSRKPSGLADGAARPAGPAKEMAQIGRCIGREFSYELLGVVARSRSELRAALDRLFEARLVFRRGTPPDALYTFKHALVQDAAYSTLLRERAAAVACAHRRSFRGAISRVVAREPELLAHHLTEAGQTERPSAIG